MGKKSRLKRKSANRPLADFSKLLVEATRKKTDAELFEELKVALVQEAFTARAERLNNLPIGHPENECKLALTFDPVERWLDEQLATGEADSMSDGTVIFRPRADDDWYPIGESFTAICDTYELIANHFGVPDKSGPLRKLANKIHYGMPLTEDDVLSAKNVIPWMKELTRPMTPVEFSEYTIAIQIRATLAEHKITKPIRGEAMAINNPNKHAGCRKVFVQLSRSWYRNAHRQMNTSDAIEIFMIWFRHPEGGTTGEFQVQWVLLGGRAVPRLEVFDDAWHALASMPELIEALANVNGKNIAPADFCKMLIELGFSDETEEVAP